MESYIKPTLKNKPELIIIFCGINVLKKSHQNRLLIIVYYELNQVSKKITSFLYLPFLDKKGKEINIILVKSCNEMNLAFVSYGSIRTRYHCNYDGLYFNGKGATFFTENTVLVLNKVE